MKTETHHLFFGKRASTIVQAMQGLALLVALVPFNSTAADFELDPTQSRITLSGEVHYQLSPIYFNLSGDAPVEEQGPGSLETGYTGILRADLTNSTITLTGDSEIVAQDSGQWRPGVNGNGGATNANYGAHAGILALGFDLALRNLKLDLTSATLPLTDGAFSSGEVRVLLPTNAPGQVDYQFVTVSGGLPLSGILSNQAQVVATLAETGEVQTLTIPIDVAVVVPTSGAPGTATFDAHLTGQLVATRTNPVPFGILSITTTPQIVTLKWESTPGRTYRVEWATNLWDWTTAADGLTALSNTLSWSTNRLHSIQFLRVSK